MVARSLGIWLRSVISEIDERDSYDERRAIPSCRRHNLYNEFLGRFISIGISAGQLLRGGAGLRHVSNFWCARYEQSPLAQRPIKLLSLLLLLQLFFGIVIAAIVVIIIIVDVTYTRKTDTSLVLVFIAIPRLEMPCASGSSSFPTSAGIIAPIFQRFLHSKYLSPRCRRCGGVAAAAAAAVVVGGGAATIVVVAIVMGCCCCCCCCGCCRCCCCCCCRCCSRHGS